MTTFLVPKSSDKFICEKCDYHTSRKSQYTRHISTDKHKKLHLDTDLVQKVPHHECINCGKNYKHHSSLYKHKQKCSKDKNIMKFLIQENKDLKNIVLEVCKQLQTTNINTNANANTNIVTNNNNNTFNLNFFLNEQCKDAINISDFVNSFQLQLSDLETTGKIGYVDGISKLFIRNLKELDSNKRPIHCSDFKRETLYIKEQDKWEKDNEEKNKLQKVIQEIGNKNIRKIKEWVKENPDCKKSDSKMNNQYMNIISNSMCGSSPQEQMQNMNKIITNVAKEVIIQK